LTIDDKAFEKEAMGSGKVVPTPTATVETIWVVDHTTLASPGSMLLRAPDIWLHIGTSKSNCIPILPSHFGDLNCPPLDMTSDIK